MRPTLPGVVTHARPRPGPSPDGGRGVLPGRAHLPGGATVGAVLAAALVPDTVLLVPGTSGRAPDDPALVALRDATSDAVARVTRGAARTVVVAPGAVTRSVEGDVVLGAAAAGVPDHLLPDDPPRVHLAPAPGGPVALPGEPGAGAVVGARAVLAAGVPATHLHVVEVTGRDAVALRALGESLVAHGADALVVVGSLAARHGDDAPLAADPRAAAHDAALRDALRAGPAAARDALADADASLAADLAVTGWGPWQVLVGGLDARGDLDVLHDVRWRGAGHVVATWQVVP